MSRSKICQSGHPNFQKKNMLHIVSRKKVKRQKNQKVPEKKVKYVRGTIYGVFRYIKIKILLYTGLENP